MPVTVSQYKNILCFEICLSEYAYICTSKDAPVYAYISVLELLLYILVYLDQGFAKIYAYIWVSKNFPLCAYIRVFKDGPLHM
jgi:hypothetical protein